LHLLVESKDFILGYVLHTKMHLCLWDDLPSLLAQLTYKINNGQKVVNPFPLLSLLDDPNIQRKATEIYVNEYFPQSYVLPKISSYAKHTKIKIGYFSADFNNHPVAILTAELYEIHDRNQFEIYAFSYGPDTNDALNVRIKAGVDYFYDVHNLLDKDVVLLARNLEIDIAVDLGGFTVNSRTGIFAMQAAPIQVNYLGYPGTMAVDYMDYIIADRTLIPENNQQYYSESIVYLPHSFLVNDTKQKISNRVFTRIEVGLPMNGFVFCCFNNFYKITPSVFDGWMRILLYVEGSVLWLPEGNSAAVNNLKKEANKNNIDENRLIFAPRLACMEDHLNRIRLADLFIDTLPYNAHTTASDALRMGLPVLTCVGESFASRVAASLLNAVNLPELITTNSADYESLAIELATKPEKLKIIKDKLVNNLPAAPLFNTPLFTQHLESAYIKMYDRYHEGLVPAHIYVDSNSVQNQ
jgi:protein O-GlcNAc transferase